MKRLLHSRHCNRHLRKCFRDSWLPTHYPLVPSSLAFRTTFPGFLYREVWPCEQCWPVKHKGTGLKWPLSFNLLLAWKADVMSGAAAAILRLIMGAGSPWATFYFIYSQIKFLTATWKWSEQAVFLYLFLHTRLLEYKKQFYLAL